MQEDWYIAPLMKSCCKTTIHLPGDVSLPHAEKEQRVCIFCIRSIAYWELIKQWSIAIEPGGLYNVRLGPPEEELLDGQKEANPRAEGSEPRTPRHAATHGDLDE